MFPDVFSAFTVTGFQGRIDSITSGTLVFPNAQSNLGGHYNFTSGKFTCVYNGVYLFLLNLYYIPEGGWQLCWIRKNGSRIVEAFTYPIPAQSGKYAESTASVILRLTKADVIDVGGCGYGGEIDDKSTFSGVLIHAD